MIEDIYVYNWYGGTPDYEVYDKCLIFLAGRAQDARHVMDFYAEEGDWGNTLMIGITPKDNQWYPMPKSSFDQEEALEGLPLARESIEEALIRIEKLTKIPREKTVLCGFSAGGVMAIEVASHSDRPFLAVACQSGAILEPDNLPECSHPDMPILLTHQLNDQCFDWEERYCPMKESLIGQGYNLYVIERNYGNHFLMGLDVEEIANFVMGRPSNRSHNFKKV